MSDTPQLLLAHHLKALKLPTFLREYDKQARQCAAESHQVVHFYAGQWCTFTPALTFVKYERLTRRRTGTYMYVQYG